MAIVQGSVGIHKDKAAMDAERIIYVTKPFLPPLEDYVELLGKVWSSSSLTNGGPMHQALEESLCEYLEVPAISLFTSGTIALLAALQQLPERGEVITTPFTFIATAHAIAYAGHTPVFVDIDPHSLNIDPQKIEEAINENTVGILPVHTYGHPCDVEAIDQLAERYCIPVIYDAAHAFGVKCHCGSLLTHGNYSVLSFHATKVFNTFEGGAVISRSIEHKNRIDRFKNFGFFDETTIEEIGINGKMNEVQAAMGLLQLRYIDKAIDRRREIANKYASALKEIKGIRPAQTRVENRSNFAYYPVLIDSTFGRTRDETWLELKNNGIIARKYFHPLVTDFGVYKDFCANHTNYLHKAKDISSRILCLPIYPGLAESDLERIIQVLRKQAY